MIYKMMHYKQFRCDTLPFNIDYNIKVVQMFLSEYCFAMEYISILYYTHSFIPFIHDVVSFVVFLLLS